MMTDLTIPIVCGPTASGKTSIALRLAEHAPIEVVSADSRQIIRYLDIGTAKPTAEVQGRVKFHLIDIVDPGQRYSAFSFIDDASAAIADILGRKRLPVVVGGTGLYLRALSEGVVEIDGEDLELRDRLEGECERVGIEVMYEQLEKIDPLEAAKVHPNNAVRIIRALEIYHLTGMPKSQLVATGAYKKSGYAFDYLCLNPDRDRLYGIINERVETMIKAGWLSEVHRLIDRGWVDKTRQASIIGYKELLDHIEGDLSLDEAVALIKQNTRRYAKRQMTWFRRQKGIRFFENPDSLNAVLAAWADEAGQVIQKT
jgi:tRNA dimethylallyltransferase